MRNHNFSFTTQIVDRDDNEVEVDVTGEIYVGTTLGMGDDPTEIFIQEVLAYDSETKRYNNILGDLTDIQYVYLLDEAREKTYDQTQGGYYEV